MVSLQTRENAGTLLFRQKCQDAVPRINFAMIQSFADKDTEELFVTESNRRFSAIARVALRRLFQMNRALRIEDLAVPPGNRLEALKGRWAGHHSIRINDQWRIVFRWTGSAPVGGASVAYH